MQLYEVYKNVRNLSWQVLIDAKISELPVSISRIAQYYKIKIIENKKLKTSYLKPNERGKIVLADEKTIIILNDADSIPVQRYTVAHELGHILTDNNIGFTREQEEYGAERFAIDILAPACVLWGLNLHTADEIAQTCNISMTAAQIRAERMEILYERNAFLTHPLERQVYAQFQNFISNNKKIVFSRILTIIQTKKRGWELVPTLFKFNSQFPPPLF